MIRKLYQFLSNKEEIAYKELVSGKIKISSYFFLILKVPFYLFETLIKNLSGPAGFALRRYYYGLVFTKTGKNLLIDVGVTFKGSNNIICKDNVWIDSNVVINVPIGKLEIGNNVHINANCFLGGRGKIILEDFTGLSVGVCIFTGSMKIGSLKDMLPNPTMNVNLEAMFYGDVVLKENSVALANSVISPNVIMEKGSILMTNSFLNKNTESNSIYMGSPAKKIGIRR